MYRHRTLPSLHGLVLPAVLVLCLAPVAAGALSAVLPARSVARGAPVTGIALTGSNVALAVGPVGADCDHVELWLRAAKVIRFGSLAAALPCTQGPSTGAGIWDVAVARSRVIWVTFAGGNLRDWMLWTATPTKRKPRQLRFVVLDVDDPPPMAIGPGTSQGVPFAVGREVVYLRDDGAPFFKTELPGSVEAIASGIGPGKIRVAAVLSSGPVLALSQAGTVLKQFPFAAGEVRAVRVTPTAVVVQVGSGVRFLSPGGPTVTLPAGAELLSVAQGRVLYALDGDLRARTVATGQDTRLVDGTPANPAHGQLDEHGLAWSIGKKVNWRRGPLPPS